MSGSACYLRIDELCEVLGDMAALRLIAAVGGTRFYVPRRFADDSPVVEAIGAEAAQRLADHIATGLGGLAVEIPRGPSGAMREYRLRLLTLAADPSLSESDVARQMKVHFRTVRRARAKLRRDGDDVGEPPQGRLL